MPASIWWKSICFAKETSYWPPRRSRFRLRIELRIESVCAGRAIRNGLNCIALLCGSRCQTFRSRFVRRMPMSFLNFNL